MPSGGHRDELVELATQSRNVDLIIPRGGEGLKAALATHATVPVIYAASGNCHVYVDAAADLEQARAIVLNAKVQRPGVCNAIETLLIDSAIADTFVPSITAVLTKAGVVIRGDETVRKLVQGDTIRGATEADWTTEYLDAILAVRIVDGVAGAIEHIARYGSHHTDAILTQDDAVAERFLAEVESAIVLVNASTQ